jgi:hypothetical protein
MWKAYDNIKIYLRKGSMSVDWIHLTQDEGQCSFAHGNEPLGSIKTEISRTAEGLKDDPAP